MRFSVQVRGKQFELYPNLEVIPEGEIFENSVCQFHLLGLGLDIFRCELEVDGEKLDRIAAEPCHAQWNWNVGFHAGSIELRLTGITPSPLHIDLITDPNRDKLTRTQFARMIKDILDDSLALMGVSGARFGIESGDIFPPDIARIEYLRQCIDEVASAVRAIDSNPLEFLAKHPRKRTLNSISKLSATDLLHSLRNARRLTEQELQALSPLGRNLAESLQGCLPTHAQVPRPIVTARRKEHADILGAIRMWQGFLLAILRRLNSMSVGQERLTTLIVKRRCEQMQSTLAGLTRLELFHGISPTCGPVLP